MYTNLSSPRAAALVEQLGGVVTDEELAAALAAEQDALLAQQLQEQEDGALLQLRLEQERADLAYAASFADTYERQRNRYIETYTGTKVRTVWYHEHALNADHEHEDEEDTNEPNFDHECDYKGSKRFNPQHNIRVAGRLEKKKRAQTALKFTPPQPGGVEAPQVPRKVH